MAEQHETAQPGSTPSGSTADVDRRRADRMPATSPARARSSAVDLCGAVRHRSSGGLFLEIEGDPVFEVEFLERT